MGYLYGFGIPIAYIVMGFYLSRAAYRSRHKRGHTRRYDSVDTNMVCALTVMFWPVIAPIYFLTVAAQNNSKGNPFKRFYTHNLPETNWEKENRVRREKTDMQNRIQELERELGMGTAKEARSNYTARREYEY